MGNPILDMLMGGGNNNMSFIMQLMQYRNNPQQVLNIVAQQYPDAAPILQTINTNSTSADMEQLCRQLCKQRGLDYNTVYNQARKIFNGK